MKNIMTKMSLAVIFSVVSLIDGSAWAVPAQIELVPQRSDVSHFISGNNIVIVPGGARVYIDVFVSSWSPSILRGVETGMEWDGRTITGGSAGSVDFARPACTTAGSTGECAGLLDAPGAKDNCWIDDSLCVPVYIDTARSDYVFSTYPSIEAVGSTGRWAHVSVANVGLDGISDPGVRKYVGTYVFDVSADAEGTFQVNVSSDPGFVNLAEPDLSQIPFEVTPASITVGPLPVQYVPAASMWGLCVLTLLLCTAGKLYCRRMPGLYC